MQNVNVHCKLGFRQKMSEKILLISNKNNERLGSDRLSDQNDHWNSNLSKNRRTCVFIGSFSIFSCVNDKQQDSLSGLIISFGTAKNLITYYRHKYWNTKEIIFISTCIFAKFGSLYSKYVHNIRQQTTYAGRDGVGGYSVVSFNPDISRVWSMEPL